MKHEENAVTLEHRRLLWSFGDTIRRRVYAHMCLATTQELEFVQRGRTKPGDVGMRDPSITLWAIPSLSDLRPGHFSFEFSFFFVCLLLFVKNVFVCAFFGLFCHEFQFFLLCILFSAPSTCLLNYQHPLNVRSPAV